MPFTLERDEVGDGLYRGNGHTNPRNLSGRPVWSWRTNVEKSYPIYAEGDVDLIRFKLA